jgi:hypothetical protein
MVEYVLSEVDPLPNVVGLDIMNEPFPVPAVDFEACILSQFYEDVLAMKRVNGFAMPLYFEAQMLTSAGLRTSLCFEPDEDGVYSVHYYDPICHEGGPYTVANEILMRRAMGIKVNEARRFGTPMVCTEFGIPPDIENFEEYMLDLLGLLNEYHIGWTYWSYDKSNNTNFGILDPEGNPRPVLNLLVQAYPQRIAGDCPEFSWGENAFDLSFDPIDTDAPTVVFVPGTLSVTLVTVNGAPVAFAPGTLHLTHVNSGATTRQTIHIEWE